MIKLGRNQVILVIVFALAAIVVSLQVYNGPLKEFWHGHYTRYNNYIIFKQSFYHLINHQNLYAEYPLEYGDFYKYSPAFAVLFAPFACLPDVLGLSLWNMLNVLLLLFAFFSLKHEPKGLSFLLFFFLLTDLISSTQNSQSNALMAALLILSYTQMKKEKYFLPALLISLATIVKIYAGVGFLLFFFAGDKRKFFVYSVISMAALVVLPALVIGFKELWWQYENWKYLLSWDLDASAGISIMGIVGLMMPVDSVKLFIQLAGVVLLVLPLVWGKKSNVHFEKDYLAFVLIWMVMFNHKAESPTYIIAFAGATLWIFGYLQNRLALTVYLLAFVMGCLTATDIFPPDLRKYFIDHHIKAFAYLPIMFVIYAGLFRRMEQPEVSSSK